MSASKPKFCPECGGTLGSNNICEKCGFNAGGAVYKQSEAAKSAKPASGSNSAVWEAVKDYIPKIGKWAWALMILHALINLISLFIWSAAWIWAGLGGNIAWTIIEMGVCIVFAIIYVLPSFSKKCESEDYDFLLNDVIKLGTIRIPKMLLFGVIVEIFSDGWGGGILIFVAVMLIFFSPKAPYNWKA